MVSRNSKKGKGGKLLRWVEAAGNRLPDPIILYGLLALSVPLLSWLAVSLGWSRIHPITGDTIAAINLLNETQIQRGLTEAVANFVRFAPLGAVLVTVMGIGVAERSGLIDALLKVSVQRAPATVVTGMVVFAGVMSSMAADSGYVVLTPLGAVVFARLGRHPLAGLAAAFAGVAGGFSANLLITSLDPLLVGFTQEAARLYDASYSVTPDANYFFMVASTFLVTAVGWWVTDRIVEPRLGVWTPDQGAAGHTTEVNGDANPTSRTGRRALIAATATAVAGIGALLAATLPSDGLLRDGAGTLQPFIHSLVPLIALGFFIPGLVYGCVAGTVTSSKDIARMLSEAMATMGGYIVMAFAAAQFIAYFSWSNLGLLTALEGAAWLQSLEISALPVLVVFILMAAGINLVLGSASAKWGIMATVFVPMFMVLGIAPETTQAAYRVGDSTTNMVTPLNPYFPIILAFAMRYDPRIKIGTLVATMLPYSIAFTLAWIALFSAWYFAGFPMGPNAPLLLK